MSSKIETVVVLGGSGNLGTLAVSALISTGFKVSVAVRQSSVATYPAARRSGFLHSANTSRRSKAVVDACIRAGVKRFLPSEYGGDTTLPDIENRISFTAGKKEFGEYLEGKESEGLTWTRVFCGPFFDWMLTQSARQFKLDMGVMGWDLESFKVTIFDSGNQEFSCTNIKTVAEAIASVLTHEDDTKNQNVYVGSFPRLTQNTVLEVLERLSGRRFDVTQGSTEDLATKGEARIQRGEWLQGYIETVSASCYAPWGYNTFGDRAEKWNAILELPEENLDNTLIQVLGKSSK